MGTGRPQPKRRSAHAPGAAPAVVAAPAGAASPAQPLRAVDGRVPGRRGLATRQKLLDHTERLLASTAFRELKVTDITRAAGTSPATFYQYFVDLEAVVLAAAERTAQEGRALSELIGDRGWRGSAGRSSAEDLVDGFLDFWNRHRPTLRVVDLLSVEGDRRFRHVRVLVLNSMTKALAGQIRTVQGERADGADPMAMAGALVGMLAQLAGHQGGFEAWAIPFPAVRESMIRLVYWGVTGPKVPAR